MSSHLRRLIARKIVHSLSGLAKQNEEKLVKDITHCIKLTKITSKTSLDKPQYVLKKGIYMSRLLPEECVKQINDLTVNDLQAEESLKDSLSDININDKSIGFKFDSKSIIKTGLSKVWKEKENFGYSFLREEGNAKTVVVEYSSPNIAKPFHVGHLRSTILGNVLANVYEAAGNKVIRLNYLGDWGTQFGLLSYGFKKYGNPEELQENALHHLFKVYVQVNADVAAEKKNGERHTYNEGLKIFKKLEEGDEEELSIWKKFRDLSLAEYSRLYERFGIKYTAYECESMYQKKAKELINRLKDENLLHVHESGVNYIEVETSDPKVKSVKLLKRDGTSLYITRDIAAILDRYERYKFDIIHYVVDDSQSTHFEHMMVVLKKMKVDWPAISDIDNVHIRFGRIQGMSTRKGTAVFLDDIVMEAKDKMLETMVGRKTTKATDTQKMEENAESLGLAALIVQDLNSKRITGYKFSWEKIMSNSSTTGTHLHYVHARLCGLFKQNAGIQLDNIDDITDDIADCLCIEASAYRLVLHMIGYEDAIEVTLQRKDPVVLTQYLLMLCQLINVSYENLYIKSEPQHIAEARLLLFFCARTVLRNGLKLLGIRPLDEF